jgi:hypothetical protein
MRGLRNISLGIAAALAIAALDVMPALADEVAASPAQAANEEKVVAPDAGSAATKSASEQASGARAEVIKPSAASKAKQAQLPLPPARPVTLAQRHWNCWWCDSKVVLMLGVAY